MTAAARLITHTPVYELAVGSALLRAPGSELARIHKLALEQLSQLGR